MKIILKDFDFADHHFEEYEFELPNVHNLEDVDTDAVEENIIYTLLDFINFNSSFYDYEESK